jgi:acyl transferase domain-containing protein/acyl carrier protein
MNWKKRGHGRGIDLQRMLAGNLEAESVDSRRLNQIVYAQPALFTIEYALARLWNDLGIIPDAIVGHSMGEYVAACLAGVLSLEDALRLLVRRTQLVARLPEGRMLAVTLPEKDILPLLNENLSISLINGPRLCVVAGPSPAVDDFERMLAAKDVICRPVNNTHAFHSRMLDPIVKEFEEEVRKVQLNEPRIPCMSNVSGTWMSKREASDPAYWARHANHTARFDEALRTLWQFRDAILLEAGPGRTLGVLAMQHPEQKNAGNSTAIASVRHHYENQEDVEVLMHGVGKLWLSGVPIDWKNLHQGKRRFKISLPTYPFERQSYWFEQKDSQIAPEPPPNRTELERSPIAGWFYVPSWKRTPFPADITDPSVESAAKGTCWLVFTDGRAAGTGFGKKLEESGAAVQVARFGERFARRDDGSFEINPARLEDYLKLFREIREDMGNSLHIVHLGCLTADNDQGNFINRNDNQDFGFFSLLCIAQAIGELSISIPIKIGIISNRMHEITGEETLNPEMVPALGLSGVIPREFPNVTCFNIDLPGPGPVDGAPNDIITRIVSEFAEPNQNDVIGYRGKHRWKRIYERVILPSPVASRGEALHGMKRLRHRGVYLITGGTGGLGLAFAKYLANTCQARIVLTKKTPFPDRSTWNELLASENPSLSAIRTIKTITAIREIEQTGGECEVFVSDVSDREQTRQVLDQTLKRFGAINGVIHAAGVVRPGLIQTKTKEAADAVLAPKVQGAVVLFDLLKDTDADFLVLISSMASITAPYAHSDYSAANAFLDAFASYSNCHRKFHTLTINWPVWKEVGIVAELQTVMGVEAWKEEALDNAILTSEGLEAFERALNSDLPQVIVSPENLELLLKEPRKLTTPERFLDVGASDLLTDPPGDEIEPVVASFWSSVFGIEQIGIHEEFLALGGHSLMAMQIVAKIRAAYPVDFSLRNFFEAPTIARLSSAIREKIISRIETLSDTEAQRLL